VVKVIWQRATVPLHMDGSVVFASWRLCARQIMHGSLGPSEPTTQTASRSVDKFLHSLPQSVPILDNGPTFPPPSKLFIPMGDLDAHPIHGCLGPPKSTTQTASRSVQHFCRAHYAHYCQGPTADRQRCEVCNCRLHLRT